MSITEATTSLDTAWTEQSTITFTTGKLSTIDDCVDEVESKLGRQTISASSVPTLTSVKRWLARAKLELASVRNFTYARRYVYLSLTAGQYRYSMPADYNGGPVRIQDTTNDRSIQVVESAYYDWKYPDPSEETSDDVRIACIKNMELWVAPPPASTDTFEMTYERSGAEVSADDFSWLPEHERFLCCDFAISEAFESVHDFDKATYFRQKWETGIGKVVRSDGRRKWHKQQRALNVFEEARLKGYQS